MCVKAICDKSCAHGVGSIGVQRAVTALARRTCGRRRACGSVRSAAATGGDAFQVDDDEAGLLPHGQVNAEVTRLCTLAADDLPHRVRPVDVESA